MNTTVVSRALVPTAHPVAAGSPSRAVVLRTALLLGCAVAVAWAAGVHQPSPRLAADPDLARLIRGMAAIKALMATTGIGLLLWRLGRPVSPRAAACYLVGTWMAVAGAALIWQLTLIPAAALAFHAGEFTVLMTAWHEARTARATRGARRQLQQR